MYYLLHFGAPYQEKWIAKHKEELKVDVGARARWNI